MTLVVRDTCSDLTTAGKLQGWQFWQGLCVLALVGHISCCIQSRYISSVVILFASEMSGTRPITHPLRLPKAKAADMGEEFMKNLALDIIRGKQGMDSVKAKLKKLKKRNPALLLDKNFFWKEEQSLLHLACKFNADHDIITALIDIQPGLLRITRSQNYAGQTVLHIAVSSKNSELAKLILEKWPDEGSRLLKQRATGPRFANTAMMGELPLSIAALTGSKEMVDLLLEHGAEIFAQNSHGDNVFHSIIRYSKIYKNKTTDLIKICKHLNGKLKQRPPEELQEDYEPDSVDPLSVWQHTNEDNLTPLHLAAQLGQAKLFKEILRLEGVYCRTFSGEGLFDLHRYDITEIDNTAHSGFLRWYDSEVAKSRAPHDVETSVNKPEKVDDTVDMLCLPTSKKSDHVYRHQSILDTISLCNFNRAKDLINNSVIRAIIRKKWQKYRYCYYVWGVLHLLYMGLFTWFAIAKTKVMNHVANSTAPAPTVVEVDFVLGFSIINFHTGVALVGVEAFRIIILRKPWHLGRIHHNGLYRLLLLLLGLSLMWDSLHYWVVRNHNSLEAAVAFANLGVTLSLLVGWWFLTFFLRGFHKFSYLTVMFQKVLIGDFVRFAVIIMLVLVAFSVTLHIALLQSDPHMQNDFSHTLFTTFLFMLGFGEARVEGTYAPWLTSVLHIGFLLLTTLLMLNALIAMMTNTCTLVAKHRQWQWELQRLAIILFLEQLLHPKLRAICGEEREATIFSFRQNSVKKVKRYYMEFTTLRSLDSRGNSAGVGAPGLDTPSEFSDDGRKRKGKVDARCQGSLLSSSSSLGQSLPKMEVHKYSSSPPPPPPPPPAIDTASS